jgi:Fuc2NAc and GlcNAc transferase
MQPLLYYDCCCEKKSTRLIEPYAYQSASHQYGRHLPVTLAVVSINMFWLLPLAACVVLWNVDRMLALIIAYVP